MDLDDLLNTVSDLEREAIENLCERAGTFDADWSVLKAAGEMITEKPRLHRVQPADLVEGKWYVVTGSGIVDNGDTFHACCLRSKFSGTLVLAAGVSAWYGHLIKTIHGPLPEYELESEVSDG